MRCRTSLDAAGEGTRHLAGAQQTGTEANKAGVIINQNIICGGRGGGWLTLDGRERLGLRCVSAHISCRSRRVTVAEDQSHGGCMQIDKRRTGWLSVCVCCAWCALALGDGVLVWLLRFIENA